MEKIIVDLGSGSIKTYIVNEKKEINMIYKETIMFKSHFSKEEGINKEDKGKLINALNYIKTIKENIEIHTYATSVFRLLTKTQLDELKKEVKERTGIELNVVTQEQEGKYIQKAVGNIPEFKEPYLIFCVGGGSTEFTVIENGEVKEQVLEEFAVGNVLNKFPQTKENVTNVTFDEMLDYINQNYKKFPSTKCKYAIFTGSHYTYNKVVGNKMQKNDFFDRKDIPTYITTEQYKKYSKDTVENRKLDDLKKLYPQDPKFMDGARASVTIISYILDRIGAEYIFPTDLNMIDGIVNELFEK